MDRPTFRAIAPVLAVAALVAGPAAHAVHGGIDISTNDPATVGRYELSTNALDGSGNARHLTNLGPAYGPPPTTATAWWWACPSPPGWSGRPARAS